MTKALQATLSLCVNNERWLAAKILDSIQKGKAELSRVKIVLVEQMRNVAPAVLGMIKGVISSVK